MSRFQHIEHTHFKVQPTLLLYENTEQLTHLQHHLNEPRQPCPRRRHLNSEREPERHGRLGRWNILREPNFNRNCRDHAQHAAKDKSKNDATSRKVGDCNRKESNHRAFPKNVIFVWMRNAEVRRTHGDCGHQSRRDEHRDHVEHHNQPEGKWIDQEARQEHNQRDSHALFWAANAKPGCGLRTPDLTRPRRPYFSSLNSASITSSFAAPTPAPTFSPSSSATGAPSAEVLL